MKPLLIALVLFVVACGGNLAHLAQVRTAAELGETALHAMDGLIADALEPDKAECIADTGGRDPAYSACMARWIRVVAALEASHAAHDAMIHSLDGVERHESRNIGGTIGCFAAAFSDLLRLAQEVGVDPRHEAVLAWRQYGGTIGTMCELAGSQGGTMDGGSTTERL